MDFKDIALLASCSTNVISIAMHIKAFLSSGEKELSERSSGHEKKLTEHDRRIQALESDMKHLPDRETTHRIEMTMTKIMGRMDSQEIALAGRFEALDERDTWSNAWKGNALPEMPWLSLFVDPATM